MPPERAVLIYDGECTFCRYWVQRWHSAAHEQFDFIPLQDARLRERFPELSTEALARAVHLVEPHGRISRGAEAVFRALALNPGYRWLRWCYEKVPGLAATTEGGYRFVASQRGLFSRMTRIFWGADTAPPTFVAVRWAFLRGMGLCYLIAFWSLWAQIDGLIGSTGIMPVADQLSGVRAQAQLQGLEGARYWFYPTLSWLSTSDTMLSGQCLAGVVLSVLVLMGVLTGPSLILLWMLYLSLATACGIFLGYQWDNLLLEAGFLSCWVASWRPLDRWRARPSTVGRLLILWLLFRLMFASGCVKLVSGDPTWADLSALQHHYETQPLPTWMGWHVHQWPAWAHKLSALGMFAIELILPFFIFGPRRLRQVTFVGLVGLMVLVGVTGNYGFFNLLTGVLALWLLDDQVLLRLAPGRWRADLFAKLSAIKRMKRPWPWWEIARRAGLAGVVLVIGLLTTAHVTGLFGAPWPAVQGLARWVSPLRSVNGYGLFAVMTTQRPEIIVEGSNDGQQWEPYEFKYKQGDLTRPPRFTGVHMPRLDWQMWFAALRGDYRYSPWFVGLVMRLFDGSPAVLDLLERNPFPNGPPRYLRARLYDYEFTNREQRTQTGAWWERRLIGEYCPVVEAGPASGR